MSTAASCISIQVSGFTVSCFLSSESTSEQELMELASLSHILKLVTPGFITAHVNFTHKGCQSIKVTVARKMTEHLETGHISGFITAQVNFTCKGCQIQSQWLGKWLDKIILTEIIKIQTHKSFKRVLFIRTTTQHANFGGNPLHQATTWHKQRLMNNEIWN